MKKNVKLTIAYDGTNYNGWQNNRHEPSIEGELQRVLEQILQEKISLQASSRTDRGVHACGQVVNFFTEKNIFSEFLISCNSLLSKDIRILNIDEMTPSFHPTLDATGKEYHYWICNHHTQLPHHRFYSWHCHVPLNLSCMIKACKILTGEHNYQAFCNTRNGLHYDSMIRKVDSITINEYDDHRLCFIIRGNHFLYKMVRNLVGTIIYVGMGKIALEEVKEILLSGDRKRAGITAPAHGLFLHKVFY